MVSSKEILNQAAPTTLKDAASAIYNFDMAEWS